MLNQLPDKLSISLENSKFRLYTWVLLLSTTNKNNPPKLEHSKNVQVFFYVLLYRIKSIKSKINKGKYKGVSLKFLFLRSKTKSQNPR